MKATKVISTAGIGAAMITGSMLAVNLASAHSGEKSDKAASEIAERFNLNEAEVKSYFEEKRDEKRAEHEEKHAERIESLVTDGTITQEQANALKAKHDELEAKKEALKEQELTREELREQFEQMREEFESWTNEQGINIEDIRPDGAGHHKHGGMNKHN